MQKQLEGYDGKLDHLLEGVQRVIGKVGTSYGKENRGEDEI